MFALCFLFGGIVVVSAQDTQDTTSNQYRTETQSQYPQYPMTQDQDRERIQATELPDPVKRTLEGAEYRGWLISGAFKADASQMMNADTTSADPNRQGNANATGAEDEELYIVELKNGAETKTLWFDSEGQQLEGMDDQQNMQKNTPGQPTYPQNNQYNPPQDNQYNRDNQLNDDPLNQDNRLDQDNQFNPTLPSEPDPNGQSDRAGQSKSSDQWQPSPSTGTPAPETPQPGREPDQTQPKEQ